MTRIAGSNVIVSSPTKSGIEKQRVRNLGRFKFHGACQELIT
jgi:hypothetical protein